MSTIIMQSLIFIIFTVKENCNVNVFATHRHSAGLTLIITDWHFSSESKSNVWPFVSCMTMELYCRKVTSRLVGWVVLAVSSASGGGSLGMPAKTTDDQHSRSVSSVPAKVDFLCQHLVRAIFDQIRLGNLHHSNQTSSPKVASFCRVDKRK